MDRFHPCVRFHPARISSNWGVSQLGSLQEQDMYKMIEGQEEGMVSTRASW